MLSIAERTENGVCFLRKEINVAYRKFFIGFPSISGRQGLTAAHEIEGLFRWDLKQTYVGAFLQDKF